MGHLKDKFDTIDVTYEITCPDSRHPSNRGPLSPEGIAWGIARAIALEQTVEVPEVLVRTAEINEKIVGVTKNITPLDGSPERYAAVIAYNAEITAYQLPQFLNVLYGNVSLKSGIKVVDVTLPESFLQRFKGPNFGIEGIRRLIGIYGRPLLATALKPMGLSAGELAEMAYALALGGVDIIKDDHGLADHSYCPFEDRVTLCQEAVDRANVKTGRATLYLPNLIERSERLITRVEFALRRGVRGLLLAPFILGPDAVRRIAEDYPLVVMAHPALTGTYFHDSTHGMTQAVLLGAIFRLLGADAVIYPNVGGRFNFPVDDCQRLNDRLRSPMGHLKPVFPVPAGGMKLDNIDSMASLYGEDTVYLVGGAILSHSPDLTANARTFLERINASFRERMAVPELRPAEISPWSSSCELPYGSNAESATENVAENAIVEFLPFDGNFHWRGRRPTVYKAGGADGAISAAPGGGLPFRDVSRQELIGRCGESTSFDLRYFQIEPGGYSSLEKHAHEHVIICVRGSGILLCGSVRYVLRPMDVAYVPPLRPHQLRNESTSEPFGFFCIVDHVRDAPLAVD
ncbi:MAG: cupin domain-containing protein [Nitrospirae bacterium]|nr:cupin domain-containing protein [Nitrospirota bacterium]